MINARAKDIILGTLSPALLQHVLPRVAAGKSPFLPSICAREAIFIHVPKAAGSSIKVEVYGSAKAAGGHRRIAEYAAYDMKRTAAFFKFAFVRNPWDRLLSAYSYLSQGTGTTFRDNQFARQFLADTGDFDGFVRKLEDPRARRQILYYDHFRPQSHWICMPGARTHAMDFLGRFETMEDDMAQLRARLGLEAGAPVKARPSQHLPYREAYSARARQTVAELYARDVALLDYSF
ncbi:sulfotransferase family protein [uncultured Roseobacter sp.]|uniref:sulfotransferase family protein n=1 Tax=uncultured Roseobacter sp. TaxID=114847 RepID=UPI00261EEDCA|nr:sulfotransferase family protein [uncultured Roseobacter sp.]